jgi:hypothetical protein
MVRRVELEKVSLVLLARRSSGTQKTMEGLNIEHSKSTEFLEDSMVFIAVGPVRFHVAGECHLIQLQRNSIPHVFHLGLRAEVAIESRRVSHWKLPRKVEGYMGEAHA